MEGINKAQRERAKTIAQERQKRFKQQVKVQVAAGTWIYVSREIAKSKQKLKEFLEQRAIRLQENADLEAQYKNNRQKRSKTTYKEKKEQRKIEIRKLMNGSQSQNS